MKKIIDEIDFLWKGDISMLTTMWLSILLATGLVIDLFVN
jgi:hypothetical protein